MCEDPFTYSVGLATGSVVGCTNHEVQDKIGRRSSL